MNSESIKALTNQIISQASQIASGQGRASVGPDSTLTDGRSSVTTVRDSWVSGTVAAASYIDEASNPIVEALYDAALNDAACEALEQIKSAANELGIGNLINL